jgi:hypothetical protein
MKKQDLKIKMFLKAFFLRLIRSKGKEISPKRSQKQAIVSLLASRISNAQTLK